MSMAFKDILMTYQWHLKDILMTCQWHLEDILMTYQWHLKNILRVSQGHVKVIQGRFGTLWGHANIQGHQASSTEYHYKTEPWSGIVWIVMRKTPASEAIWTLCQIKYATRAPCNGIIHTKWRLMKSWSNLATSFDSKFTICPPAVLFAADLESRRICKKKNGTQLYR